MRSRGRWDPRRCARYGCITLLRAGNPGPYCSACTAAIRETTVVAFEKQAVDECSLAAITRETSPDGLWPCPLVDTAIRVHLLNHLCAGHDDVSAQFLDAAGKLEERYPYCAWPLQLIRAAAHGKGLEEICQRRPKREGAASTPAAAMLPTGLVLRELDLFEWPPRNQARRYLGTLRRLAQKFHMESEPWTALLHQRVRDPRPWVAGGDLRRWAIFQLNFGSEYRRFVIGDQTRTIDLEDFLRQQYSAFSGQRRARNESGAEASAELVVKVIVAINEDDHWQRQEPNWTLPPGVFAPTGGYFRFRRKARSLAQEALRRAGVAPARRGMYNAIKNADLLYESFILDRSLSDRHKRDKIWRLGKLLNFRRPVGHPPKYPTIPPTIR